MFSEREHQILQCLVNGLSNKAIARKHHIAEATVKVHVKGLLRKVQVSNRTQAAIWALNRINGVSYTRVGAPRRPPLACNPPRAPAAQTGQAMTARFTPARQDSAQHASRSRSSVSGKAGA